ncbi:MAG TPA: NAD(P)-binding domain-containing protein [Chthoniobacteraceae bacterium]|jgi:3-hydroxyisobutyrate dehydrogenase-like beta-hydroxyacid dehydrogenase
MSRKSRKHVGLIGLGIIGSRAAAGLRAAGYQTYVWNRTPRATPNFLASPAEVAQVCEIIQIFVADAQALFDVIQAFGDTLTADHVIICSATVGPEATLEAAKLVGDKGARFLDAPFTGSKGAAEKRELVYYIGGDEATFLRAKPVLEATSKAIIRIGAIGQAAVIKVVTNMIAAVSIQTLAEALAIVRKSGLKPQALEAALEHNACRSGTMELKLPKMLTGDYDPHFSLKHMFKDVQLGIHMANALDVEIPATTVSAGVMYGALNHGWGDLDFSAIFKVYEPLLAKMPPVIAEAAAPSEEKLPLPQQPHGESSAGRKGDASPGNANSPARASTASGEDDGLLEVVRAVPKDAKPTGEPTSDAATPSSEGGSSGVAPAEAGGNPLNRLRRFFSSDQK